MVPCGSPTLGEPQRRSDAELAQQAIQLTGEFAESLAGFAGLLGGQGAFLRESGGLDRKSVV